MKSNYFLIKHGQLRKKITNIDNKVISKNDEQKKQIINNENNEDKIKNLEKLLNVRENELERSKKESNRYYKLYLEFKESKKVDLMNLENRIKELIKENNDIKNELKEKTSTINAISEQYTALLNKNKFIEGQKETLTKKINSLEQNNNDLTKQVKKVQELNENLNNNNLKLQDELEQKSKSLIELTKKIQKYKDILESQDKDMKSLKEKVKYFSKISDNYEICQKTLNEKNNLLLNAENKINILNDEKKRLDKENIQAIEEYNKKISLLENEINKSKIKFDSMEKELNETHSKFDGSISHFEKMDNQIKEQEKKLEELSTIKEENEKLKEKNLNYEQAIQKGETKDDYLMKQAEEYYDVVIDINSINSLKNEGWSIKYNQQRKEIYDKIIGEQTIKIGVLGLNNVGKSFLLSKIVRAEIPTGYSIETKGISIKYAKGDDSKEEKGICILDSAGFETPLLKEEKLSNEKIQLIKEDKQNELENAIKFDEVEDELSRDKAQTERFIEQLIISLSDMIILVIGKLTRTEQRLITRIKNMSKKSEKNKIKSIIIVHNLAQYHKKKEVEKHIQQYLTKSATFELSERDVIGIEKFKGRKYHFENSDDSEDIQVFHYIMAKEGTEAGDYYNNLTMELIRQQYNNFNKRRAINIPDEIINLFSELSTDIIGEKMECQKSGSDKNVIKLADNQINKFQKKKKICVQNAYIDQDGNYLKNKGKFEPKYSLYYYKEKKDNDDEDEEEDYEKYLLLRLEIPGNVVRLTARSTDPKTEKFNGIVIKGIKKIDEFKEQKKDDFTVISDNRSYDDFTYFIELKRNLELSKTGAKGNTDIYEIEFDKRNKEKFFLKDITPNNNNLQKNDIKLDDKKNKEANDKNNKELKLMNIASGVYVMKFQLTERSYIPNK